MHTKIILWMLLIVMCGCATPTNRFVIPGMRLNEQNEVVWLKPNGAAMNAGVRQGDKITLVNGVQQVDCKELLANITDAPNSRFEIEVLRNGSRKHVALVPESKKFKGSRNYAKELGKLVSCNQKINLIVLVVSVENNMPLSPGMDELKWRLSKRNSIYSDFAKGLLEGFGSAPNFKIIEREALDEAFKELKLQLTGAISQESVKKLGKMNGASHIFIIEFARFPDGYNNIRDLYSSRLIEVETGSVLAIDLNAIDKDGHHLRT